MIGIVLKGNAPIYEQLVFQIEELILRGVLKKDEILPSVREVACDLAVNPNTVQKAYSLLEERGITYSIAGKGRFVALSKEELNQRRGKTRIAELERALREAKQSGMQEDDVLSLVRLVYEKEGDKND